MVFNTDDSVDEFAWYFTNFVLQNTWENVSNIDTTFRNPMWTMLKHILCGSSAT